MLELDADLPPGALIGAAAEILDETVAAADCLWFHGAANTFVIKDGAIDAWRPRSGVAEARPTQPNEGNARLGDVAGHHGLVCQTGLHCGLSVPGALGTAARFTMAVIYQPSTTGETRTLLTVNTAHGGGKDVEPNYLFLSDGGDAFTVKDTKGTVELNPPVTSPTDRPRLAIVTLNGATVAFQENRGPVAQTTGSDPGMDSGAELFIAARSHRKGLQKTLGDATILDVFLWSKHTLLIPRGPDDLTQLQALHRYFMWEY